MNKLLRVQEGRFEVGAGPDGPVNAARRNLIAGLGGHLVSYRSGGHFVSLRGNAINGADETLGSLFLNPSQSYHAERLGLADATLEDITPVIAQPAQGGPLRITVPLGGPGTNHLAPAVVDLYLAAPGPVPQGAGHLRTYVDKGLGGLDPPVP